MKAASDISPEANTRKAISHLLAGNPPNGIAPKSCGDYRAVVETLYSEHGRIGTEGVRQVWDGLVNRHPEYARLLAGEAKRYNLHWLGDAMKPHPPIRWIVEGVIQEGSLNMFVGHPGSFKTWLALDLLGAVADGQAWIGRETERVPVLIVDEESGRRRLEKRIAGIARARHMPHEARLAYVSLSQFDFRQETDEEALRDLIEEVGAGLVLIDALADIMPGGDENAVSDTQPLMLALRKVAEDTRAAIVLIHHTNKGGTYRGSSAISGALDLMIKVDADDKTSTVELKTEKVRDVEPFSLSAHIRFDDAPFKVFVSPADPADKQISFNSGEKYVLDFLKENGASTVNDITRKPDTCATSTARKGVYSLAEKNLIRRTDQGGAGEEATYELCQPVPDSV